MRLDALNYDAYEEGERLKAEAQKRKEESYFNAGARWARTSFQTVKKTTADTYNYWVNDEEPEQPKNQTHFDFGWGTGTVIDSYTWTYVANGDLARTPHGYSKNTGRTHESVHPVVGYRMYSSRKKYKDAVIAARDEKDPVQKAELMKKRDALEQLIYNPIGMKSVRPMTIRTWNTTLEQWEYVFHGNDKPMPEYNMRPSQKSDVLSYEGLDDIPKEDELWYRIETPAYERLAIHGDFEAGYYLKKLDERNGYKNDGYIPESVDDLDDWFNKDKGELSPPKGWEWPKRRGLSKEEWLQIA